MDNLETFGPTMMFEGTAYRFNPGGANALFSDPQQLDVVVNGLYSYSFPKYIAN